MKTNWKKIVGIVAGFAILAIVVLKLKNNKEVSQKNIYQYDREAPITVSVDTIKLKNVNNESIFSGTFEPNKESKISSETQGKVNEVLVEVGSVVNKGQPLVVLDNTLLQLQLQSADLQIEGLEADVNRFRILAKADAIQGVQLEKAELGLKSAKTQKETILEQINKTSIKAPFDGVVTAKFTEVGSFAAPGVPLIQITELATLKFTVNVPENELWKFKINTDASVTADAFADIELTGKSTLIGSKANIGNSFPVQFTVKNTGDLRVKSGMFGKVKIKAGTEEQAIVIPTSAVIGTAENPKVYLIRDGKAVLSEIRISQKWQNESVVSNGLKANDVIVTDGFINLFEGANVTVDK